MSAPELWECENCGQRAINGNGHGWTARGDERWHRCEGTAERLLPRPAFRIDLTPVEQALVGMIRGMRRWAADEDGVHDEAWDAYVAAHKALKLPEPRESIFDDARAEEQPAPPPTRARALADGVAAILAEDPDVVINVADYGLLTTGEDGKRYSDALAATLRGLGWRFDTNSAQWTVPL